MDQSKRWVFVAALVGTTLHARSASACHTGEDIGRALFSVMTIGIDIPLTLHDLVVDDSSKPYAVAEVVVAGGLAAGSIAFAIPRTCEEGSFTEYPTATSGERVFMVALAVWNVALVAHGVRELAKPRRTPRPVTLVPVMLDSDTASTGVGLALAGRF